MKRAVLLFQARNVEQVNGGMLTTLEGNTDAGKTREGGGVYRLTRKIADVNKGFVDYSAV
jgi:hypothetical protein